MSELFRDIGKEKTSPPPFRVSQMDEAMAFAYGKWVRKGLDYWLNLNYPFVSPDGLAPFFDGNMEEEEFRGALHEWYKNWDPALQVRQLRTCEQDFNDGIRQYLPLQKWGFAIPDAYDVYVTPFAVGAGGAGVRLEGYGPMITMWYGRNWTESGRTPQETLLHEGYHLGVEAIIEQTLRQALPEPKDYQPIRERIVDLGSREVLVPQVLAHMHVQNKNMHLPVDPFMADRSVPVPERLQRFAASLPGKSP